MTMAGKVLFCSVLVLMSSTASAQVPGATLQIEPRMVLMDLFYSGAEVKISGTAPAGEDLVLLCTGEETSVELKQKGKVWGLLWLNVGDAKFDHMPALYKMASSKMLKDLAPEADLISAGVGFSALEARSIPKSDEAHHRVFMEFMKLKEHEGLYSIQEGQLMLEAPEGRVQKFSAAFHFPASAKSGVYAIRLIGFDNGKATTLANGRLSVQLSGLAAWIKSISLLHGLMYGIFAVVVALAAGLSTGLVFGRRTLKGGH